MADNRGKLRKKTQSAQSYYNERSAQHFYDEQSKAHDRKEKYAEKNPYGSRLIDDIVEELHGQLTKDPTGTQRAIKNRDRRLKREGKPAYKSPLRKLMK